MDDISEDIPDEASEAQSEEIKESIVQEESSNRLSQMRRALGSEDMIRK